MHPHRLNVCRSLNNPAVGAFSSTNLKMWYWKMILAYGYHSKDLYMGFTSFTMHVKARLPGGKMSASN